MRTVIALLFLAWTLVGHTAEYPPVPAMYESVAVEHNVPIELFYALMLNESKSRTVHSGNVAKMLPWPWTINHRGKAHFFETKQDAMNFMDILIAKKDYRFDVGLGQLNWYWHRQKFNEESSKALDPKINLTVAAKYLKEQYAKPECDGWAGAIGCYHRSAQGNKDKQIAMKYAMRVIKIWSEI